MGWLLVCGFGIEFSRLVSLSESGRGLAQSGTLARGLRVHLDVWGKAVSALHFAGPLQRLARAHRGPVSLFAHAAFPTPFARLFIT